MKPEEWVAIIGYRNANKLFLKYGGRSVHIPKFPTPEHALARLLGFEILKKLSDMFPSEQVFVPRMNAILDDFRDRLGLKKSVRFRKNSIVIIDQQSLF